MTHHRKLDACDIAAELIADVGHLDALDGLEEQLAQSNDQVAASRYCELIDAVEAVAHGRLH